MPACTQCGTLLVPGAQFCQTCGFALIPSPEPIIALTPPDGTQKATIGPTPISEIIGGLLFIAIGIIAGTTSPFFAPIAIIIVIAGIVLIVLGVAGVSIPQQQVIFQRSRGPVRASARASPVYEDSPKSFLKRCQSCGERFRPTPSHATSVALFKTNDQGPDS